LFVKFNNYPNLSATEGRKELIFCY